MLELGDQLRLRLEPAHERRLVDQLGADDLDRHLAPDRGLVRAIDDAEVAAADLLAELVASHRAAERARRDGGGRRSIRRGGKSEGSPSSRSWKTCCGLPMPLNRNSPSAFACQPPLRRRQRRVRVRREEHLAAVRGGEHPAGAIEHRAEVVSCAGLDLADVDRHPHVQRLQLAPVGRGELALDLARGGDRRPDVREGEVDAVADTLHDASSGRLGGAEHDAGRARRPRTAWRSVCSSQRTVESSMSVSRNASVCTCGSGSSSSDGIVVEDPALEVQQMRRGLEAELLGQVRTRLLVRTERFRLTAGAVEREHVLRAEALVDRELLAQHLQLSDQLRVTPERELGLDPRFDGAEA